MKYLIGLFLFLSFGFISNGQALAPFLQYKTLPSVKLFLSDSTGFELKARLTKGKPLFLFVFSPECDHCQHETEEIIKNIDKFKGIQIIMVTNLELAKMNTFIKTYHLDKYPQIIVARDYAYVLPVYYDMKNLPFHAFYNVNKQLISGFEGSMHVPSILKILGK